MKAMILAAGLGTRLRPLTNDLPKALIKIKDKTLLEIAINNIISQGFTNIIINVHHHSQKIIRFLQEKNFGAEISVSDESKLLLDTGGGLKKAQWFFDDSKSFLLYNVDVISNSNLKKLFDFHNQANSIATLVVRKRESSRYLLFNENNILCGWENVRTGEKKNSDNSRPHHSYAFSGIHVIDPKIFSLMPNDDIFSMIDLYLKIMDKNKISAFYDEDSLWIDAGKPKGLKLAERNYFSFIKSP